jgi:hypothetical protein
MSIEFDPGYVSDPFRTLAGEYPDDAVYPADSFRVEWGPVFHRGRLDGTARILVVGQDPATHEAICRRILVGEAGQRIQGFLAKLGVTRSYVYVNTFLYSVYGQSGGERHVADAAIAAYRNRWIDAIVTTNPIEAIVSLGHLADTACTAWRATPTGAACPATYTTVLHPTYPDSASRSGTITKAAAFARLCASWNTALELLHGAVTADAAVPLVPYGTTITSAEHATIPSFDLPAGLPAWMRSLDAWAARTGPDAQTKRATITVSVPTGARTWPVVH